jgi:hypothetical protein
VDFVLQKKIKKYIDYTNLCVSLFNNHKKMKMTNKKKHTLLKGEGVNQHTLYGNFSIDETQTEFSDVLVKEDSLLKHEQPNGEFSNEHQTLKVEKGDWVMGKQVEYNPFEGRITQIWD